MIKKTALGVVISSLLLGGCGGSDSSSHTPTAKPLPTTPPKVTTPSLPSEEGHLIGTAATGAPITGQLTLLAADGSITEYSVQEQGAFDFDSVSDLKTPALLQIVGGSGGKAHELYSIVLKEQLAARVVNVTPLTQLLISRVTGVSAAEVFNSPENHTATLTLSELEKAQDELKDVLAKLLVAADINPDFDLLSGQFKANYKNIDAVLDLLDIEFGDSEAIVTYRANRNYQVTLPYGQSWSNLNLLPDNMPVNEASEALSYIVTADSILESMILEQDQDGYMAYVHPDAVWFGATGNEIWNQKQAIIGNETNPDMDRYRDLALTEVDSANHRYQVTYTERFENSDFASGGRAHAWFAKDSKDGKYKFLGQEEALPVNVSMFVKLEAYTGADDQFNLREWRMEIDAFPNYIDCDKFTAPEGGWGWRGEGDFSFVSSLPDASEHLGFDYVKIEGPGIKTPLKLDKVYKTEPTGDNEIAGCHLVSSEYHRSPVIEGYGLDFDFEKPDTNLVPDNSVYTLSYYKDGETSPYYENKITIGKGTSAWEDMLPLMPNKTELRLGAGDFYYKWSRVSELVTDTDLWVYKKEGHIGAGHRVAIEDGAKEVSRTDMSEIGAVYHASFDPYGRVITRGYQYF
ncbi:nuclear transport factor 2 family protein [Photobacterium sp. SDRW27]|uniref:nuclear transport factor 2 family protein n=1 Tax=Photobacterium obscurum TaxID=2829490 RepID=UPI00224419F2|nr:nuclear transport factor 2 family protein [Photobacterium obscurum]MCW8332154.1 nuclear transport factor 2 family protein [Photobacterium obscurum]